MANIVQLKRSSVSGRVPDAGNVEIGEPVVNLADRIIFTKNTTGSVIVVGAGTTSNVTEGINLYFSNARVSAAISSQTLSNVTFSGNISAANVVITNASRLGTITSGTWNGSSISTTFTDAKVTSVNGQTGAATGFATTANSLSQFASTTSAQLAGVISDETGSGALVFATSPTLVTPVLGLATGTSVMLSANIGAAAGNVSGNFTAGNFQTTGNVVASNVTVSNRVNFGNATTSVIVYQVYNSTTNSLDTVFI